MARRMAFLAIAITIFLSVVLAAGSVFLLCSCPPSPSLASSPWFLALSGRASVCVWKLLWLYFLYIPLDGKCLGNSP